MLMSSLNNEHKRNSVFCNLLLQKHLPQYGVLQWKRLSQKAEFNFANRIGTENPSALGAS
jgi:hypothetical protein